jgi:hypothetical protein
MGVFRDIYKGIYDSLVYEQLVDGSHVSYVDGVDFSDRSKLLHYAQKHPVLTFTLDFVSKLFSRADFWVEKNGVRLDNHWLIDLLNNPGFTLTRNDFLRQIFMTSKATGTAIVIPIKSVGFDIPTKLRIIDTLKVEFPSISLKDYEIGNYDEYQILLDRDGEATRCKVNDAIFVRDLPLIASNVVVSEDRVDSRFVFTSYSRFESQLQTLYNTVVALEAKEIILKTNGKELYSSKGSETANMGNSEKEEIQRNINSNYGLSKNKSRAIITKAALDWKSLHIAMRDLGLEDSIRTDADLIFGSLQVKDLLSLDGKKSSYRNQKESIVSYYQNVMQQDVDDFCATLTTSLLDSGYVLKGGFDHLQVMKYIIDQKYKGIVEQARALKELQAAGVLWEDALPMVDMNPNLKRNEEPIASGQASEEDNSQGSQETEGEDQDQDVEGADN